jgi:glycosyltransferase involved in cell wall biosynthesis
MKIEGSQIVPKQGSNVLSNLPVVTVIVPCRNEERYIGPCLESIMAGGYPSSRLEVLVLDGESGDRSAEIVRGYCERFNNIRLISNPHRTTPWAMNLGIKEASGSVIVKADAHSTFGPEYIPLAVRYLYEFGADDVGGVLETLPGADSRAARAVASVLSSRYGAGNSYFRIGANEPRWVDTVAYGCYRRDVFDRIGLYNTHLTRSQDIDLNSRLRRAGGRILLHPALRIRYFASPTLSGFFKHNFTDGEWAILPVAWGSFALSPRHLAPMALVICFIVGFVLACFYWPAAWTLAALAVAYMVVTAAFSLAGSVKYRERAMTSLIFIAYCARHFGYGIGSIWGCLRLLVTGAAWRRLLHLRSAPGTSEMDRWRRSC